MIEPTSSFKENLQLLPSIEGLARIELVDPTGAVVATIENKPGKQGSLVVYQYLHQEFGAIDAEAATHGLAVFAEHTADAKARPGAHPNIDLLFGVIEGDAVLEVRLFGA
ncbi:DUF2322 family protein [Planktotalea sp.]|uniref:DUF2322 family protein n=1 Tax=Planktotalea sp. TaxID=2029877 RepID=UPI003D6B3AF1